MWAGPIYSSYNSPESTVVGSEIIRQMVTYLFIVALVFFFLSLTFDWKKRYFIILVFTFGISMPFAFGEIHSILEIPTFLFSLELGLFSIRKSKAEKLLIKSSTDQVVYHLELLKKYYLRVLARHVSLFVLASIGLYYIVIYLSDSLPVINRLLLFFMIVILLVTLSLIVRFMKDE